VLAVEHADFLGEEILRLPLEDAQQVVCILGLHESLVERADPIDNPPAKHSRR
jgi:hypothetical protein